MHINASNFVFWVHKMGEPTPGRKANEHARERGKARSRPSGGGGKVRRHTAADEAREMGKEIVPRRGDGAKGQIYSHFVQYSYDTNRVNSNTRWRHHPQ